MIYLYSHDVYFIFSYKLIYFILLFLYFFLYTKQKASHATARYNDLRADYSLNIKKMYQTKNVVYISFFQINQIKSMCVHSMVA